MPSHKVVLTAVAAKQLRLIPRGDALRIAGAIELLQEHPIPPRAVKLRGRDGYRIRVGNYQMLYQLRSGELLIMVIHIAHRQGAYS